MKAKEARLIFLIKKCWTVILTLEHGLGVFSGCPRTVFPGCPRKTRAWTVYTRARVTEGYQWKKFANIFQIIITVFDNLDWYIIIQIVSVDSEIVFHVCIFYFFSHHFFLKKDFFLSPGHDQVVTIRSRNFSIVKVWCCLGLYCRGCNLAAHSSIHALFILRRVLTRFQLPKILLRPEYDSS